MIRQQLVIISFLLSNTFVAHRHLQKRHILLPNIRHGESQNNVRTPKRLRIFGNLVSNDLTILCVVSVCLHVCMQMGTFSNWQFCLGRDHSVWAFWISNCCVTFTVRNIHTDPPKFSPLSERAIHPMHYPRSGREIYYLFSSHCNHSKRRRDEHVLIEPDADTMIFDLFRWLTDQQQHDHQQ